MKKLYSPKNLTQLDWLKSAELIEIFDILLKNGGKAFCVGGCVRDSILGQPITDIDIATDLRPQKVKELFESADFKVLSKAMKYGTVTILSDNGIFQITTFRADIETYGRHAKVRFSKSIREDAKRRDFTINAIYMSCDGKVLDPLSCWNDLLKGYVRFIGDPVDRIEEDFLRILRYFRFVSSYSASANYLDEAALSACADGRKKLSNLSIQRVWFELRKILSSRQPLVAVEAMETTGVLHEILPNSQTNNLKKFLQYEREYLYEISPIERLIALNSRSKYWINKFPFSRIERKRIETILAASRDRAGPRIKGFKYGYNASVTALAIFAKNQLLSDRYNIEQMLYGSKQKFPLNSDDFLKFIKPSKEFGDEIKRIKKIWFESNLEIGRNELLLELKRKKI